MAARKKLRVVCAREFQNSIEESVHKLLSDTIVRDRLPYTVEKFRIHNALGSEFIFKGLSKQDAAAIKSLEGADIVWVEEAQNVSNGSWQNLIPTVRKDGSEIWVTFNPDTEDGPTYKRFVLKPPPGALVMKVNWNRNPWFPKVLDDERRHLLSTDPDAYDNVWRGNCRKFTEGAYFRDQMTEAEKLGRIGDVPHDPSLLVWAFWDMGGASGKGDPNAIWFIQATATGTYNVIDYWEGNNLDLVKVAKDVVLKRAEERGYRYAKQIIPHDGGNVNRQTGKTDEDVLESLGLDTEVQDRTANKDRDVRNIRLVIPKCRFDKERVAEGLAAMRNYRQEKDEKTGLWVFKHDWTSHGVDAYRGFSVYQNDNSMIATLPRPTHTARGTVPC